MQKAGKRATNPILKKADDYLKNNKPKEAITSYLTSIFTESDTKRSHIGVSKAYKELKQYEKAIKHLEKAKKLAAFDCEIYFELGLNHLLNTNFDEASKNFRKTIKLDPNNLNAQIQLAISHELMDESLMAFQIYDKIIEENKEFIPAYNHKAGLLMGFGEFEEAAKIFHTILKIDETYFRAYLGLGICFDKLEKYTLAARFYKKYIAQNPKSETAQALAGRIMDIYSVSKIKSECHLRIAK